MISHVSEMEETIAFMFHCYLINALEIDDFRVSIVVLHKGMDSGQSFTKCRDLGCDFGTTTIRKL